MKAQVLASPTSTPLLLLGPAPGMPFRPQMQPRPSQPCLLAPPTPALVGKNLHCEEAQLGVPELRWRKGWPWGQQARG